MPAGSRFDRVPPFGDGSSASLLYRIVHNEPDVRALACENKQLRALIEQCLIKEPAQRPTAEEIAEVCASAQGQREWLPPLVTEMVASSKRKRAPCCGMRRGFAWYDARSPLEPGYYWPSGSRQRRCL